MQNTDRSAWLIGYSVTLIALSSLLVVLRLMSRWLSAEGFWWDDALIAISLLGSYPFYAGVMLMVHNGVGRHLDTLSSRQLENLLKLIYAGNFPYILIISITKTSILLFYLRLFGTPGTYQTFQKLVYCTQALVVMWVIASIIPGIFRCHPMDDAWNPLAVGAPDIRDHCIDNNTYYVSSSAFNVALDFWILGLPLSIIWTLKLSGRRRVGLSVIFLLGCFICGASIARAYTVANVDLSDFSYYAPPSIIWSSIELSVGIICACLPTVQPILQAFSKKIPEITSRPRPRRQNSGSWFSGSAARGVRGNDSRDRAGTYAPSDEELATLRPTRSDSKSVLETVGMTHDIEGFHDNKSVPVATIGVDSPRSW